MDRTPTADGGTQAVCPYCGAKNYRPPVAPPRAPDDKRPSVVVIREPKRSALPVALLLTAGFGVLTSLVVTALVIAVPSRGTHVTSPRPVAPDLPRGGGPLKALTRTFERPPSWDSVGGAPVVVSSGGRDVAVGRLRNVGAGDELSVAAFDLGTLEQLWRTGPLGTYSEGVRSSLFTAGDGFAVVSDPGAHLRVLDLATGEVKRTVDLTDVALTLCAQPGGKVWVEQVDKRSVMLDASTGELSADVKKPKGCRTSSERFFGDDAPRVRLKGLEVQALAQADGVAVAWAEKSPGTPVPWAVGLDPKTRAERWRTPLSQANAATVRSLPGLRGRRALLCGDRFIALWGSGQKAWHVTALDPTSGAHLWTSTLRPIFAVDSINDIGCTASRLFLVRMLSLEVLDVATGELVGNIGQETFESPQ